MSFHSGLDSLQIADLRALCSDEFLRGTALVKDALKGRKPVRHTDRNSLLLRKLWQKRVWRNLITFTAVVHMSLAFVERPSAFSGPATALADSWPIELCVCLLYIADLVLHVSHKGWRAFLASWKSIELVATVVFLVDLVTTAVGTAPMQFSRTLRPLFVITKRRHIRQYFSGILDALPQMLPVATILGVQMLVGAFAGTVLLSGSAPSAGALSGLNATHIATPPYCSVFVPGCTDYFQDISTSLYTTYDLTKRTNWPLVLLPTLHRLPATALFFLVYVLVVHFFVYRLLLATAFGSFNAASAARFEARLAASQLSVHDGFGLLAPQGVLTKDSFVQVGKEVAPWHSEAALEVVFAACAHGGVMQEQHFEAAVRFLTLRSTTKQVDNGSVPPKTDSHQSSAMSVQVPLLAGAATSPVPLPGLPQVRRRCVVCCSSRPVQIALDVCIIGAVVVELVLTAKAFAGQDPSGKALRVLSAVSAGIAAAFAIEALTKLALIGFVRYWGNNWNRLDALVAAASVLAVILQAADATRSANILKTAILLRAGRFFRILRLLRKSSSVFVAIRQILPLLWRLLCVLCIVLYVFAIVGMEMLAFRLAPTEAHVQDSSYGTRGFWSLNFDSFFGACVTVFSLLVETQSAVLAEGAMAAFDSWWPLLFFVGFTVVVVWLVMNVLVALIVQSFNVHFSDAQRYRAGDREVWQCVLRTATAQVHGTCGGLLVAPGEQLAPRVVFSAREKLLDVNTRLYGSQADLPVQVASGAQTLLVWPEAESTIAAQSGASMPCKGAAHVKPHATVRLRGNMGMYSFIPASYLTDVTGSVGSHSPSALYDDAAVAECQDLLAQAAARFHALSAQQRALVRVPLLSNI